MIRDLVPDGAVCPIFLLQSQRYLCGLIDCSHFHFLCFESARLPRGRVPSRRSGVPDKDQPDSIPVPKSDFIRRALARRSQVRISSSDLLC